jgi:hypothetical protein
MAKQSDTNIAFTDLFQMTNEAMKGGMSLTSQTPQQFADAWLRVTEEFLRFASHRFAAQAELFGSLRKCADVDSLVKTETRFFENAADEYSQELDRLAGVASERAENLAASKKKAAAKAV